MGESYTDEVAAGARGTATTEADDAAVTIGAGELQRLRELAAMGEALSRFRHDVNNPLTALLAEAQLLELEPLDAPTREAVGRIVAICRRVIAGVRALGAAERSGVRPARSGSQLG